MGFKQVKAQVIECLNSGRVRHEQRGAIDIKNLLATGAVTPGEVAACSGVNSGLSPASSGAVPDVYGL